MVSESVGARAKRSPAVPPPVIRLRTVLAIGLLALGVHSLWPRGYAAWNLHNLAVVHANYALCMVGTSGPSLMRDDPESFLELVRRRVVSSSPAERPLEECAQLGERMGLSHEVYRVHIAEASDFSEYANRPGAKGRVSVRDLDLSLHHLSQLADQAWPFVRSGATTLMKPSSYAKEASYAPPPPRAGQGSGLPASRHRYRSTAAFGDTIVVSLGSGANAHTLMSKNGGIDWTRGGGKLAEEVRDRCVADDEGRGFLLSRMNDGRRIVLSQGPSAPPQVATLGTADEEVAGVSCDESALVAAVVLPKDATGYHPAILRVCPFRRPCREMLSPDTGADPLYYPVDVARVGGDTVVARTAGGITRVSSTRDDGRSWLPWTVAYDFQQEPAGQPAPFRLLVAADRVLLYSGSNGKERYPLLISEDHGASFRAPNVDEAPIEAVVASAQ